MKVGTKELGSKIDAEDGIANAISAIGEHIPEDILLCDVCNDMDCKSPARMICLDCKLKLCCRDNYIIHFQIPGMRHHRRHRNRVVQWNETKSNSHAFVEGFGELKSTWREGLTDAVNEPLH